MFNQVRCFSSFGMVFHNAGKCDNIARNQFLHNFFPIFQTLNRRSSLTASPGSALFSEKEKDRTDPTALSPANKVAFLNIYDCFVCFALFVFITMWQIDA